jgi:transposase
MSIMDISARVRRKVWPEALKREIVEAACAPGASVSVVARRYDVNANLVFTWRRLYRKAGSASAPAFLPVMVTADQPAATPVAPTADAIEIEMPGGYRVRCGRSVKAASLRVVLDALERR